jgi:Fe-S-cluster-containing hydrogenase component 2
MPMRIVVQDCHNCGACLMACPQKAIEERAVGGVYTYQVVAERCNECVDQNASLCRGDCPVPECLIISKPRR